MLGAWTAVLTLAALGWLNVLYAVFRMRWRPTLAEVPAEAPPESGWPRVSVIVPSRDEEEGVEAATRSLLAQDYPDLEVVKLAHAWAQANLEKRDPFRVEPMDATSGLIMMTGNEAGALGSVFGGVSVAGWYPITPSTSFIDSLREYLGRLRRGPDGRATYSVVQAEDELAAIGIVVGAGWAGARAVTATSGPGISLMAEFLGLAYYAEVPAVVWDIQRVGPSTGMPTLSHAPLSSAAKRWNVPVFDFGNRNGA